MRKLIIPAAIAAVLVLSSSAFALEARTPKGTLFTAAGALKTKKPVILIFSLCGAGGSAPGFVNSCPFPGLNIRVAPHPRTPGVFGPSDYPAIKDVIEYFLAKYNIERVVMYGFSQGACIGAHFAVKNPELVSGVIQMAGSAPSIPMSKDNPKIKRIAWAFVHGTSDGRMPINTVRNAVREMKSYGYPSVYSKEVSGGHGCNNKEILNAYQWMLKEFKKGRGGGEFPWNGAYVKKVLKKALGYVKKKKFDKAEKTLDLLYKYKHKVINAENGKEITEALRGLEKSEDAEIRDWAVRNMAYAGPAAMEYYRDLLAKSAKDEKKYLLAVAGLKKCGKGALAILHPLVENNPFGVKGAKAVLDSIKSFKSMDSFETLIRLLQKVEKKKDAESIELKEALLGAMRTITGQKLTTFDEWNRWWHASVGKGGRGARPRKR